MSQNKMSKKETIEKFLKSINEKLQSEGLNIPVEEFLTTLKSCSLNNKYALWMLKTYLNDGIQRYEDFSRVKFALELIIKHKNSIPVEKRDINKLKNITELEDLVEPFIEKKTENDLKKEEYEKILKETIVIRDDDEAKIVIPKTRKASIFWGQGTRWCTAAEKSINMFEHYNKNGNLYIVMDKKTNSKTQISFTNGQVMNELDAPVEVPSILKSEDILPFDYVRKNERKFSHLKKNDQLINQLSLFYNLFSENKPNYKATLSEKGCDYILEKIKKMRIFRSLDSDFKKLIKNSSLFMNGKTFRDRVRAYDELLYMYMYTKMLADKFIENNLHTNQNGQSSWDYIMKNLENNFSGYLCDYSKLVFANHIFEISLCTKLKNSGYVEYFNFAEFFQKRFGEDFHIFKSRVNTNIIENGGVSDILDFEKNIAGDVITSFGKIKLSIQDMKYLEEKNIAIDIVNSDRSLTDFSLKYINNNITQKEFDYNINQMIYTSDTQILLNYLPKLKNNHLKMHIIDKLYLSNETEKLNSIEQDFVKRMFAECVKNNPETFMCLLIQNRHIWEDRHKIMIKEYNYKYNDYNGLKKSYEEIEQQKQLKIKRTQKFLTRTGFFIDLLKEDKINDDIVDMLNFFKFPLDDKKDFSDYLKSVLDKKHKSETKNKEEKLNYFTEKFGHLKQIKSVLEPFYNEINRQNSLLQNKNDFDSLEEKLNRMTERERIDFIKNNRTEKEIIDYALNNPDYLEYVDINDKVIKYFSSLIAQNSENNSIYDEKHKNKSMKENLINNIMSFFSK